MQIKKFIPQKHAFLAYSRNCTKFYHLYVTKMFILKYKTHKEKFSNNDGLKVEISN